MSHTIRPRAFIGAKMLLILGSALVTGLAAMIVSAAQEAKPAPGAAGPSVAAKRTVLITGANRGLGLEFAKQYHAAGWTVIATAREPAAAADLKSLGSSVTIESLDVADAKSVDALAQRLKDHPIDLLINNAGVSGNGGGKLQDVKPQDYAHVMEVNAIGPMRVTRALLANLRAGAGRTVVSISSGLGSIEMNTGGGYYGYRESKAALNMFMRTIAAELRSEGFICIAMSPGWVKTDMGGPNAELTPEQSIAGMRKVIDALKPEDSGKFWSHKGTTVPW
jgi:NAD(P)-dependent dehydrogenase (short-subunit alcohol dehydrogenase family)